MAIMLDSSVYTTDKFTLEEGSPLHLSGAAYAAPGAKEEQVKLLPEFHSIKFPCSWDSPVLAGQEQFQAGELGQQIHPPLTPPLSNNTSQYSPASEDQFSFLSYIKEEVFEETMQTASPTEEPSPSPSPSPSSKRLPYDESKSDEARCEEIARARAMLYRKARSARQSKRAISPSQPRPAETHRPRLFDDKEPSFRVRRRPQPTTISSPCGQISALGFPMTANENEMLSSLSSPAELAAHWSSIAWPYCTMAKRLQRKRFQMYLVERSRSKMSGTRVPLFHGIAIQHHSDDDLDDLDDVVNDKAHDDADD